MCADDAGDATEKAYPTLDELIARHRAARAARSGSGDQPSAAPASYRLARMRVEHGLSQSELAREMGVSQKRVSVIESGAIDHLELSTITKYVEALGGRVRVVADFGEQTLEVV